jgi:hypothetical protein
MSKPAVILVHGLWMKGLEMTWLRSRLRDHGYSVRQFHYHTVSETLADKCKSLRKFILLEHGEVALIGHSLGGVVSLHTLRMFPDLPVKKIVCLGSPLVDTAAGRSLHSVKSGRTVLGRILPEAIFENPLGRWEQDVPVGVIAGTRSIGPGQLIAKLTKPNDGTVSVLETQLPGVADHLQLPYSHTTMLFAPAVVAQCDAFLRGGRFTRD